MFMVKFGQEESMFMVKFGHVKVAEKWSNNLLWFQLEGLKQNCHILVTKNEEP